MADCEAKRRGRGRAAGTEARYRPNYEREKGRYAMPDFVTAHLTRSAELQMRPLIIFDYNNPHYDNDGFPNSPEAIAAFGRYAVDLAADPRLGEDVRGPERVGRRLRHEGPARRA